MSSRGPIPRSRKSFVSISHLYRWPGGGHLLFQVPFASAATVVTPHYPENRTAIQVFLFSMTRWPIYNYCNLIFIISPDLRQTLDHLVSDLLLKFCISLTVAPFDYQVLIINKSSAVQINYEWNNCSYNAISWSWDRLMNIQGEWLSHLFLNYIFLTIFNLPRHLQQRQILDQSLSPSHELLFKPFRHATLSTHH